MSKNYLLMTITKRMTQRQLLACYEKNALSAVQKIRGFMIVNWMEKIQILKSCWLLS